MEAQECGTPRCTLHSFIVPYTSVCLHLQQRSSLTDCSVDIIRQSSCMQYDIISMATSWGAGREVHSGSSSLTSTADVMEEQHQPQADSSHQHWIRPHHVPSCKDCAAEVLHNDSTVKRIARKLYIASGAVILKRSDFEPCLRESYPRTAYTVALTLQVNPHVAGL